VSCHDYYILTSSAPNSGCRVSPQNLGQTIIENLPPEFLSHFQKQLEDSVMMLASTQESLYVFTYRKKLNTELLCAPKQTI
jgi:hypothetical protein